MNLRDQLLKAGLVDKKRADQVGREKRKDEKIAAGHQVDKATRERQEAEAREVQRRADEETRIRKRREADAREAEQRKLISSRQILRSHRVRYRPGPQRFWHWSPDRREAWRLDLPEHVASDLRLGRLVIAWVDGDDPEVVLIEPLVANRIEALRPELILFRNRGPVDTDPSQQLWEPPTR